MSAGADEAHALLEAQAWPEAEEIARLRAIYGWRALESLGDVAPDGHPPPEVGPPVRRAARWVPANCRAWT